MNAHPVIYSLLAVTALIVFSTLIRVVRSPAYQQNSSQVVVREPGNRTLGPPIDGSDFARDDVEFALLSQAAYQRTADAKQVEAGESLDPDQTLTSMGWCRWTNFPEGNVKKKVDDVHLRVEVWSNSSTKKVAVAFGGTVARNIKDWRSDLRWFIPSHQDEYTVIVKSFGQAFIDAYQRRISAPECAFPEGAELFSTGHSLGGGLAQEFAYSLPLTIGIPPVKKVFAFDPSPVTGFFSVRKSLREKNSELLAIDRIYERGEILAYFRSLMNFIYPPSSSRPMIRQLRYNLFPTHNPFASHSIAELACRLRQLSQRKTGCGVS